MASSVNYNRGSWEDVEAVARNLGEVEMGIWARKCVMFLKHFLRRSGHGLGSVRTVSPRSNTCPHSVHVRYDDIGHRFQMNLRFYAWITKAHIA